MRRSLVRCWNAETSFSSTGTLDIVGHESVMTFFEEPGEGGLTADHHHPRRQRRQQRVVRKTAPDRGDGVSAVPVGDSAPAESLAAVDGPKPAAPQPRRLRDLISESAAAYARPARVGLALQRSSRCWAFPRQRAPSRPAVAASGCRHHPGSSPARRWRRHTPGMDESVGAAGRGPLAADCATTTSAGQAVSASRQGGTVGRGARAAAEAGRGTRHASSTDGRA